ncbi:MAG: hypothetical protein GVY32_04185 [Gammaproteobacteria bacterium]|jgi:hypothetical protein|nr:hypothetical protein [Gammaproteobacteria bacterium]
MFSGFPVPRRSRAAVGQPDDALLDRIAALEARPRVQFMDVADYDPNVPLPTDVLTILTGTVADVRALSEGQEITDDMVTFTFAVGYDDGA